VDTSDLVIDHTYSNDTGLLNVTWNDGTGETNSVRVLVYKDTVTGQIDICDQSTSSSSGTVSCNVSQYEGDVIVKIYSPSSDTLPFLFSYITIDTLAIADYLDVGSYAFMSFILVLLFVGIGAVSPVASVVAGMFGVFIISLLGINPIVNTVFLIVTGVLGTVIAMAVKS
jgi:hypothetical protein